MLGDRRITVCRELTKFYEEVFRGVISQALEHFTAPRGEFVLVVAGATPEQEARATAVPDHAQALTQLTVLRASGVRAKAAVSATVESTGLSRKVVYQLWLEVAPAGSGESS